MEKEKGVKGITFFAIAIFVVIVFFVIVGSLNQPNNNQSQNNQTNTTIDVKPNTKVSATTVNVAKFYNGQDGYSLSIPSGNNSTCIWTYAGGSADIPYSQTTYANSATEKHTILIYDYYDFKVNCTDDFGNQYTGIFPK